MNLSIFGDRMHSLRTGVLLLALHIAGVQFAAAQAMPDATLRVVGERNALYAETYVQDSIPVRLFLESGVQFPLIDSALVWSHPESFDPIPLERTVRFRMAGGSLYTARYKLPPGVRIGTTHSLRDTYVVDLRGQKPADVLYPLNTFSTDSVDAPGIFELDIRAGMLRMLTPADLPGPGEGWDVYELVRDEKTGMYLVEAALKVTNEQGRGRSATMELVLDLGNANLLALFAFKPDVKKFVARSGVEIKKGHTPSGTPLRVLIPTVTTFMGRYPFSNQTIVVLDQEMNLPGDGFLGVRFFRAFRMIFDLRHERLWVSEHTE